MKIDNVSVYNIYPSIISLRNATQTWKQSDTTQLPIKKLNNLVSYNHANIGPKDRSLIIKLLKLARETGKSSHRKFLRQILVSFDLLAPKSFWSVFDSYKIGVTTSSSNTLTTLTKVIEHKQKLEINNFEYQNLKEQEALEEAIKKINLSKDIDFITTILPQSFLLKKSWTGSYENLLNIYLDQYKNEFYQWKVVIKMTKKLPLMDGLIIPNSTL